MKYSINKIKHNLQIFSFAFFLSNLFAFNLLKASGAVSDIPQAKNIQVKSQNILIDNKDLNKKIAEFFKKASYTNIDFNVSEENNPNPIKISASAIDFKDSQFSGKQLIEYTKSFNVLKKDHIHPELYIRYMPFNDSSFVLKNNQLILYSLHRSLIKIWITKSILSKENIPPLAENEAKEDFKNDFANGLKISIDYKDLIPPKSEYLDLYFTPVIIDSILNLDKEHFIFTISEKKKDAVFLRRPISEIFIYSHFSQAENNPKSFNIHIGITKTPFKNKIIALALMSQKVKESSQNVKDRFSVQEMSRQVKDIQDQLNILVDEINAINPSIDISQDLEKLAHNIAKSFVVVSEAFSIVGQKTQSRVVAQDMVNGIQYIKSKLNNLVDQINTINPSIDMSEEIKKVSDYLTANEASLKAIIKNQSIKEAKEDLANRLRTLADQATSFARRSKRATTVDEAKNYIIEIETIQVEALSLEASNLIYQTEDTKKSIKQVKQALEDVQSVLENRILKEVERLVSESEDMQDQKADLNRINTILRKQTIAKSLNTEIKTFKLSIDIVKDIKKIELVLEKLIQKYTSIQTQEVERLAQEIQKLQEKRDKEKDHSTDTEDYNDQKNKLETIFKINDDTFPLKKYIKNSELSISISEYIKTLKKTLGGVRFVDPLRALEVDLENANKKVTQKENDYDSFVREKRQLVEKPYLIANEIDSLTKETKKNLAYFRNKKSNIPSEIDTIINYNKNPNGLKEISDSMYNALNTNVDYIIKNFGDIEKEFKKAKGKFILIIRQVLKEEIESANTQFLEKFEKVKDLAQKAKNLLNTDTEIFLYDDLKNKIEQNLTSSIEKNTLVENAYDIQKSVNAIDNLKFYLDEIKDHFSKIQEAHVKLGLFIQVIDISKKLKQANQLFNKISGKILIDDVESINEVIRLNNQADEIIKEAEDIDGRITYNLRWKIPFLLGQITDEIRRLKTQKNSYDSQIGERSISIAHDLNNRLSGKLSNVLAASNLITAQSDYATLEDILNKIRSSKNNIHKLPYSIGGKYLREIQNIINEAESSIKRAKEAIENLKEKIEKLIKGADALLPHSLRLEETAKSKNFDYLRYELNQIKTIKSNMQRIQNRLALLDPTKDISSKVDTINANEKNILDHLKNNANTEFKLFQVSAEKLLEQEDIYPLIMDIQKFRIRFDRAINTLKPLNISYILSDIETNLDTLKNKTILVIPKKAKAILEEAQSYKDDILQKDVLEKIDYLRNIQEIANKLNTFTLFDTSTDTKETKDDFEIIYKEIETNFKTAAKPYVEKILSHVKSSKNEKDLLNISNLIMDNIQNEKDFIEIDKALDNLQTSLPGITMWSSINTLTNFIRTSQIKLNSKINSEVQSAKYSSDIQKILKLKKDLNSIKPYFSNNEFTMNMNIDIDKKIEEIDGIIESKKDRLKTDAKSSIEKISNDMEKSKDEEDLLTIRDLIERSIRNKKELSALKNKLDDLNIREKDIDIDDCLNTLTDFIRTSQIKLNNKINSEVQNARSNNDIQKIFKLKNDLNSIKTSLSKADFAMNIDIDIDKKIKEIDGIIENKKDRFKIDARSSIEKISNDMKKSKDEKDLLKIRDLILKFSKDKKELSDLDTILRRLGISLEKINIYDLKSKLRNLIYKHEQKLKTQINKEMTDSRSRKDLQQMKKFKKDLESINADVYAGKFSISITLLYNSIQELEKYIKNKEKDSKISGDKPLSG